MALGVTQSIALNTLLRWIVAEPTELTGEPPNAQEALDAALALVKAAEKSGCLSFNEEKLRQSWPGFVWRSRPRTNEKRKRRAKT